MVTDSSSTLRETPHVTETITISNALKRRAQSVINDTSIDPQWRAIVRYGLETNDPWLGDLVRRADAGEPIIDTVNFSLEPQSNNDQISEEKIEALTEMICWAGDESAAALFVLMGTLETPPIPNYLQTRRNTLPSLAAASRTYMA